MIIKIENKKEAGPRRVALMKSPKMPRVTKPGGPTG